MIRRRTLSDRHLGTGSRGARLSRHVPREKIFLRRNGVEVPAALPERGKFRASHGISPDAKVVLFLGRLSAKKSPDLLLEAFAKLPAPLSSNNTLLVFAGPG